MQGDNALLERKAGTRGAHPALPRQAASLCPLASHQLIGLFSFPLLLACLAWVLPRRGQSTSPCWVGGERLALLLNPGFFPLVTFSVTLGREKLLPGMVLPAAALSDPCLGAYLVDIFGLESRVRRLVLPAMLQTW